MKRISILVAVVLALGVSANAQNWIIKTGNDLLAVCEHTDVTPTSQIRAIDYSVCTGWVQGFIAGHENGMLVATNFAYEKIEYADSNGFTQGQAMRIVTKYLRDHPEETHRPAGALAYAALRQRLPQPKR